jgi:hypothetical protein
LVAREEQIFLLLYDAKSPMYESKCIYCTTITM